MFIRCQNLVQSLNLPYKKHFLSVVSNHSKSDIFTVNWIAERVEIRQVYSTEFLLNRATIRAIKLDCTWLVFAKKLSGEKNTELRSWLQHRATNNHTNSQNRKPAEMLNWIYFPCHLKADTDKVALINRRLRCKKWKDRRSPLVHSRKIAEHDNFTHTVSSR